MNEYLRDYLAGVQASGVSGFEHLNTLMVRDKLFEQSELLTSKEKAELRQADHLLIQQASEFLSELQYITTLEYEQKQRKPSPERWWWYLDIISHLPIPIELPTSDNYAQSVIA